MGNPHPFYRFKQAWNAGFYPDNQIEADLLNEIYLALVGWLPGQYTGKTIGQWYALVKQFCNQYNESPYFGNLEFTIQKISDTPNWEYNINIFNLDLSTIDSSQVITINGFFNNSTQLVVSASVNSFTPGSYSGSFTSPLINEELKVKEALEIVNINGSAIFPITYSFDPVSNVATSGLARGDNWFINGNGVPDRQPVPNLPYENRRTFELPQLNGDDNYVISIMERIIQASLIDTDYVTSVAEAYLSYSLPDGWTSNVYHPGYTTYERVQFDFIDSNRRKFSLVGRLDGNWKWQRFVSDDYLLAPYDFLTAYAETTPLPYEPSQAGRWIYPNTTYDFEFVEFTSGCYESPEFYAMPAKPGDQFQFNVFNANLTGIDSVNVGLFEQDGTFIQKIGEAKIVVTYTGLGMYGLTRGAYSDWYSENYNPELPINFQFTDCDGNLIGDIIAIIPAGGLPTSDFADFKTIVEGLAWPSYLSVVVSQDDNGEVVFDFTLTSVPECFCSITGYQIVDEVNNFFIKNEPYSQISVPTQLQASVTIPSKKAGCYRMGLYNDPTTTCDLTFTKTLDGTELTDYIDAINTAYGGGSSYATWNLSSIPVNYNYLIPSASVTATDIATWCNANIPGMTVTEGEGSLTFTWVFTDLACDQPHTVTNCLSDVGTCIFNLWTVEQYCECGTSYYLYSLSNIINIDPSDCFSTILEFWSDNNSMAEGFEYFDNWKQKVRIGLNGGGEKPVLEENLYRQSNGVHRRPQNKQDLSLDLHTDFFDLETQLAMTDATRHPYIIWSGKPIFVKGDIEVATIQDFTTQSSFETLSQMKFQALLQGFQPRNSSCLTC